MRYLIVFVVFMLGCDNPDRPKPIKPKLSHCDTSQEQREWVSNCVRDANPKSDEEPEDWIRECYEMSVKLYCGNNCYLATNGSVYCRE